jgi:hypothetical protein
MEKSRLKNNLFRTFFLILGGLAEVGIMTEKRLQICWDKIK